MKQKITLSLDEHIVQNATSYAHSRGENLSQLIENYLSNLSNTSENEEIPEDILRWKGIIKLEEGQEYDAIIQKGILKKQG
jgi:hypothetical protein